MPRLALAAVPVAAVLAVARAHAQDAAPVLPPALPAAAQVAPPPATPGPRWKAEVDLGYVSAAGVPQQYWVSRLAMSYQLDLTTRASCEQKPELLF